MFVSFSHRFLPFASNAGIKAYRCQAFVGLCRWRKAIASTFALRLFPADLSLIRQRGDSDVAAVIPPSRGLPPVEFCRGTKPSQAANSRPERVAIPRVRARECLSGSQVKAIRGSFLNSTKSWTTKLLYFKRQIVLG